MGGEFASYIHISYSSLFLIFAGKKKENDGYIFTQKYSIFFRVQVCDTTPSRTPKFKLEQQLRDSIALWATNASIVVNDTSISN